MEERATNFLPHIFDLSIFWSLLKKLGRTTKGEHKKFFWKPIIHYCFPLFDLRFSEWPINVVGFTSESSVKWNMNHFKSIGKVSKRSTYQMGTTQPVHQKQCGFVRWEDYQKKSSRISFFTQDPLKSISITGCRV